MKRHAIRVVLILLGVAAIVLVALFLKDSTYLGKRAGYDADAPTDTKFARLARWIPPDAEFYVTVDVPKALANPDLRKKLGQIVGSHSGVAAELVIALLENEGSIGLLTVAGNLGDGENPPKVVVIAQGEFNEEVFLPSIRAAMSAGKAGLTARNVDWTTIYYESNSRRPFGFTILDGSHMAVGERQSLEAFFLEKPEPPEKTGRVFTDVIFGHIEIGPRLRSLLPSLVAAPKSVDFSSADGLILSGSLICESRMSAMSLAMFIKGVKSLITLQQENNPALVNILEGITVDTDENTVTFTTKMAPLMDLWDELDEEGNYPAILDLDESPIRQLERGDDRKP